MEYSEVVGTISTVFELDQVMGAINALKDALYKTEEGLYEKTFRDHVPLHMADVFRKNLPQDREKQTEYLEGLKKALEELPIVSLTTAFYPTEGFLAELVSKMREVMKAQVLVDVKVRRLLLGGARVEYGGRFKDYSVRNKLTEILEAEGSKITSWGTNGEV